MILSDDTAFQVRGRTPPVCAVLDDFKKATESSSSRVFCGFESLIWEPQLPKQVAHHADAFYSI